MYKILATTEHVRDYVQKAVNKPLTFPSKDLAQAWIKENAVDGVIYKAIVVKPKKAKPLHRRRHYGRRSIKEVSLEAMIEKQAIVVR